MCSVCRRAGKQAFVFRYELMVFLWLVQMVLTATPGLAQKNPINYCTDPNWLPYEAIERNQHIGLSSDYIKVLSDATGHQFNLIKTATWEESIAALKSGQCMLLPMLNQTEERNEFLDFSVVYFSSPNVLVTTDDKPFLHGIEYIREQTLGLTQGYRIEGFIKDNYPDIKVKKYASEADGLLSLSAGEVDLFIGSVHSVNFLIQTQGLTNLKLAGWGGPDDTLRMGIAKGQQPLLDEIDQVLAGISKQQHFDIYNRWNDVKVIDNTNYQLIWIVSAIATALFLILLTRYVSVRVYNARLTHKNRQLHELQRVLSKTNDHLDKTLQKDPLTKLYNRHYFNRLVENHSFNRDSENPLSLILLDLDFFKLVNDNHGHVMGDEVLKEFGKLLKKVCKKNQLVCRWGGEEFLILMKHATVEDAEQMCHRIQQRMAQQLFSHQKTLTCSFGIAQLRPDESLMACFERADQMLYQAKNQGRNRIGQVS